MAVRIESGSEPIPGYKLIERLGGGGFGEVWKAEAPGGLFKAIKFVYGDLQAADDDDGARAEQELKAMSRVKTVHHPYILSLERYDIIDGQLIIVMELADRTLWDRYKEARSQGLPGIPRDELLNYMQETAEALDLMNVEFQLQHLDIKPQNLFLVFKHIKVADFGLVKDLGSMGAATMTGGVTPVYAAPETFDGWLSRYSDQYSLAIVYQELLTGQRPFAGNTMRQLVLQHLQSVPEVSPLPAAERPVILRALSKNPDERFPTCVDMVQALRASKTSVAAPVPAAPAPSLPVVKPAETASCVDSDFFKDVPSQAIGEFDKTWSSRRGSTAPPSPPPLEPAPKTTPVQVTPSKLPPRPPKSQPISGIPARARTEPIVLPPPSSHLSDANAPRGIIQPALVIGLGNYGVKTLQQLRGVLSQEFGNADAVPHVRLLGINTDGETMRESSFGSGKASLRPHEFVLARLHRPNHYVGKGRGGEKLPTAGWLNSRNIYRITKENSKATIRPLGRFAFVTNLALISKRIDCELQACCSQDTLHEMNQLTDLGVRSHTPRVYIAASLSGSTGSGMFLDMAYLVRSRLRELGHANAEIVGIFYLPPVANEGIRSACLANAHAALAELQYFTQTESMRARYDTFDVREPIPFEESGPPFQRCLFMTLAERRSLSDAALTPEAVMQAGQYLYRDLATPLGKAMDRLRMQRVSNLRMPGVSPGALYETFGFYRLGWPRREVEARLAERFCTRLVDRWKSKNSTHLAEEIAEWVGQQWDALELRPENLIAAHQDQVQQRLSNTPEKIFQEIITPTAKALADKGGGIHVGPVLAVMDQFEKLIGIPEPCRDATHRNMEPGTLERTLMEVSAIIADQCDQKLAEIVVGLIEAPRYRLAGAEEALRRLSNVAEKALKIQETLASEIQDRSAALFTRIIEITNKADRSVDGGSTVTPAATQWFGRNKGAVTGADLVELMRSYSKTQYQALLLQCLNRLYISLRGHLSDQLREVGFCRTRLDELSGYVREKKTDSIAAHVEFEKHLLPTGCTRLVDAVDQLDQQLTEDDFLAFDDIIQSHVRKQYKALLNICLGASGMVRALAPVMLQEAETYLGARFIPPNVVDLLQQQNSPEAETNLEEIVRDIYEEASPEVKRIEEDRHLALAALPGDEPGQALSAAVAASLPAVKIVFTDRCDEIVFLREQFMTNLAELDQMGPVAHEAYRQRLAQDPSAVHSREDIDDWSPQPAPV